ncbi:MAG: MBL fold metallo-hydrolase [Crocinitomicaceae bacterium]|nr:MBL fold metallo-hydrolase [Crocinitomicaceae bacterium]
MQIKQFTFNPFQENTFIIYAENKEAIIIDPGFYEKREQDIFFDFINKNELNPIALLNTHAHIDHVLGNNVVVSEFNIPYYLHSLDVPVLESVKNYAHLYGFQSYLESPNPTNYLEEGKSIFLNNKEIKVLFTPGHSPGHVVFYLPEDNIVINGDVLFKGSFGRVDLPGGDLETLKKSIHEVMFSLPEETLVYCGHGPETTIGEEKRSNYILSF